MSTKHRLVALLGAGLTVVALTAASVGSASADNGVRRIELTDDCDPASFNAAIGPGTCVGDGETTFAQFLKQLSPTHVPEDWAFDPSRTTVKAGQKVIAKNVGGETHTFTCVTQFGGGVVPFLNAQGGFNTPAVLCAGETFGASAIPSGGQLGVTVGSSGTAMYQCLIHPWMRSTLRVRGD
jgi:plastocyanin